MNLVIVSQRPYLTECKRAAIQALYPNVDYRSVPVVVFLFYSMNGLLFDLPRNIPQSELPATRPVRHRTPDQLHMRYGLSGSLEPAHVMNVGAALRAADRILLVCDEDCEAMDAGESLFVDIMGAVPRGKVTFLGEDGSAPVPFEDVAERAVPGRLARLFDFNYLLNARPLFGEVARRLGLDAGVPSAFGLQLLYHLRKLGRPVTMCEAVEMLEEWRGLGKYSNEDGGGMGNYRSRLHIVEQLIRRGYLLLGNDDSHSVSVTPAALLFLSALHKDCCDPDLPFRIKQWGRLPWPDGQAAMFRYIRRFFGKKPRSGPDVVAAPILASDTLPF